MSTSAALGDGSTGWAAERMSGHIEWVDDPARFAALASQWEQAASGDPSPFGDHAWFWAWWQNFGSGALRVCVLWEDGAMRAALPLSLTRGRLISLANAHTPFFGTPARDPDALHRVVAEVLSYPAAEVIVQPIGVVDPLHDALQDTSTRARRRLLVEPLYRSLFVEIEGDFEAFERSRAHLFKDNLRRWRKLEREHSVHFRFGTSGVDLEAELERFYVIEASGWKGEQGTAISSSPETRGFYGAIARAYQGRGELRLVSVEIDDQPAAVSLCLLRGRRLYTLKLGVEERFRRHAPGLLLYHRLVERSFALGLERCELLGGEAPYKNYFATGATNVVRLRSYRNRPATSVRYLGRRVGRPVGLAVRARLAR